MPSDKLGRAARLGKQLSAPDREALAADLLTGLADPIDDQTDEEWAAEIRRRIAEIEAGTAELIDVDVVIAELTREAKLR